MKKPVLALVFILAFCRQQTALERLQSDCRDVCSLERGICYEKGVVEEAVATCVDYCADEEYERAQAAGDACALSYEEFYECAATWQCGDFLGFGAAENPLCEFEFDALKEACPDLKTSAWRPTEPEASS